MDFHQDTYMLFPSTRSATETKAIGRTNPLYCNFWWWKHSENSQQIEVRREWPARAND